jgi:hypothetical protein
MCTFVAMICNARYLGPALENLMNWSGRASPGRQMNAAMPPERLAAAPKRFFPRNSNIFQQVVVQLA